ncbi:MAG: archaetidylserine decarboxylase [Pseudomonadales bacterium]|uniref:Phosphatidylserine decarboxylase proenzyme n=1 Tax=Oleiphilus messinensis TaxID=141451 RepID=A0A1Y0I645_9GAMM|nr:archaetidylserine decarboxylase [Oleiphilus messinensis]ARU55891.1 phosphatidylserine decarboxylase [Oleiphilus messinensis]MCG8613114.1 archaetidylserine decarboxylase [Pseudomonadales bacterium]
MRFDNLFVMGQHLAPQHGLSRAAGMLANSKVAAIKNPFINWFIKQYNVNMAEAEFPNAEDYADFNTFFTRALKPGVRPIDPSENTLVSPVDGTISQIGRVEKGKLFQAKGQDFSLIDLLGGSMERAKPFVDGEFTTIYLSPKDYHRIHMPEAATLREMVHVPGRLFSVNPVTTEKVSALFARNERVVCIFDTAFGPMAMILVGAMIVASIETSWAGLVAPSRRRVKAVQYGEDLNIRFARGDEMGRFKLGSTVVLVTPPKTTEWLDHLKAGSALRMGEPIANLQG